MFGWFKLASTWASRWNRASRSGSLGQDLQRHLPVQLGIGGLIDLPHAPLADEGDDVVVAESGADGQGHEVVGLGAGHSTNSISGEGHFFAVQAASTFECRSLLPGPYLFQPVHAVIGCAVASGSQEI